MSVPEEEKVVYVEKRGASVWVYLIWAVVVIIVSGLFIAFVSILAGN